MQIRKCQESDIVSTGAFYDKVITWLDAHINYPKWIYRIYPSEGSVREMVRSGAQYICTDDQTIIGAFVLSTDPQGNYSRGNWTCDLREGSYLTLHAFAVEPDIHGQGLGSKMLQFCIEKARSEGYKALRLDIVPTNIPARRLYEKNGFQYVGEADLERGIEDIPVWSLFELIL